MKKLLRWEVLVVAVIVIFFYVNAKKNDALENERDKKIQAEFQLNVDTANSNITQLRNQHSANVEWMNSASLSGDNVSGGFSYYYQNLLVSEGPILVYASLLDVEIIDEEKYLITLAPYLGPFRPFEIVHMEFMLTANRGVIDTFLSQHPNHHGGFFSPKLAVVAVIQKVSSRQLGADDKVKVAYGKLKGIVNIGEYDVANEVISSRDD
jgi:hypothetical protein